MSRKITEQFAHIVKSDAIRVMLSFWEEWLGGGGGGVYPYFLHLVSDVGEIHDEI